MQSKMVYLTESSLPTYMQFPKFLLDTDLSYTAMIIYMTLLDRARLSMKNGWKNEKGITYLVYPVENLAKDIHRGQTTVKDSISELRRAGLIETERLGLGRANRIYVRVPAEAGDSKPNTLSDATPTQPDSQISGSLSDINPDIRRTDNCPFDSRNTTCQTDGKLSTSNNNYSNTDSNNSNISNHSNTESRDARPVGNKRYYGCYNNVALSDEDITKLKETVNNYAAYIDSFSCYMQEKHKTYNDHAAQIVSWAVKDNAYKRPGESKYDEEDYIL